MFKRTRYQFGWLELRKRKKGPAVWLWRYRGSDSQDKREKESVLIGSVKQYPTRQMAWRAAEGLRLTVNQDNPGLDVNLRRSGRQIHARKNRKSSCISSASSSLNPPSHYCLSRTVYRRLAPERTSPTHLQWGRKQPFRSLLSEVPQNIRDRSS